MRNRALHCLVLAAVLMIGVVAGAQQQAPAVSQPGHTVTLNGMEMYYEVVGDGEPLLLLHGGTQSGQMWEPFRADLATRYRLIIPDLRGHGGSANPGGAMTTRQFAKDISALLDHVDVSHCKAIGASIGGMTLLRMAAEQPGRIDAMVVVGVGTDLPPECRAVLAPANADLLSESAWQALRARHKHGDAQIRALYGWVASLSTGFGDMRFEPSELATISAATLIVNGDRDYCFPASMALDIYRAIPKAFLWVVPNGSHVPVSGTNAQVFTQTVLEFLAGDWQQR